MGDRCISMPTMFSVPGGTPVGGDCQGISLGWLSGDSFSIERVTLGVWGTECPHKNTAGGPKARTGAAAKPPLTALGREPPIPTRPRQRAKNGRAGQRPATGEAGRRPAQERAAQPPVPTPAGKFCGNPP